jgi:hypothetical protein
MPRLRKPPKPTTHNADLGHLPTALTPRTAEKRWVVWKWTWRDKEGRWDKPPLQACNPKLAAKSNDSSTWGNYADAIAAVTAGRADGIGYMLADDNLGAVDLDHCVDLATGKIHAWAKREIDAANGAYVEVTVSGRGLRILGLGEGGELGRKWKILNATNGAAIEIYRRTNRYITISGKQILGGAELPNIDAVLDDIARRYDDAQTSKTTKSTIQHTWHSAELNNLIQNGAPKGTRSEIFAKVVWALANDGCTLGEIIQTLVAHPNGIAAKYTGRLEREVERCYRKWTIQTQSQPLRTKNPSGRIRQKNMNPSAHTAMHERLSWRWGSSADTTNSMTERWSVVILSISGLVSYPMR